MTLDLERQLQEYADILDSTLPVMEAEAVIVTSDTPNVVEPQTVGWAVVVRRPWLVAAAALLVVLVVIGGVSLLFAGGGGVSPADDPVDEPVVTPTTEASVTTAAGGELMVIPGVEGSVYVSARWLHTGFATQEEIGGPTERVEQVWYLDDETWRREIPVWRQGDSDELEGNVTVVSNGQRFEFRAMTNSFYFEEADLVELDLTGDSDFSFVCGDNGCDREDGDHWDQCATREDVTVLGRSTDEYTCARPPEWNPNEVETLTLNIDETGRTLRGISTHTTEAGEKSILIYEILEIDLNPTFTSDQFEFECPTQDCRDEAEPFDASQHPLLGSPSPQITGQLVGGGNFDLEDHQGERVIVLFWASWCPPCYDQLNNLEAFATTSPDITIFTGAIHEETSSVEALITDLKITLPVIDLYSDYPDGYLTNRFDQQGGGIPMTVFIDETGIVVGIQVAGQTFEEFNQTLQDIGW